MALESKLTHFFDTQANIHQCQYPDDVKEALVNLLSDPDTFKAQRMSTLLMKTNFTTLEWLEWFNWYYVVAKKLNEPDWFTQAKASIATSKNITCMSYPQLLQHGWQIKDIVISSVLLSDSGIANYHANDNEVAHWCRLRSKNINLFSGAILAGELIGQVGFIKLNAHEYELLRQGKLAEEDIRGVSDTYAGPVYLYVPSVVLKPEWRKKSLMFKLFTHLTDQLERQHELVERVQGLIALAYTKDGASLCDRLNFKLEQKMENGERIYTGDLSQLLTLFGR
ncbi:hypothetical protein DI392_15770 [Vibrio albus]|uniref:Uncharacterized protein n=1 Tax=Vibrio albus TaxID=2200953 RepID=A0A2U3B707_9VIBR|nr:hypothetical protein [Vibrio albus]PWI32504.1 hypothetical protein DI392_15770 [Vibrio albus]